LKLFAIKNKKKLNKKKLFDKEILQRKVNATLNLKSAEIKIYNNSKSKRTEITTKDYCYY